MLGMALATVAMGSLPTYLEAGILAPVLLALCRLLQSFCAAGESAGGAIFILEHTESSRRSLMSGVYDASSVGGILIASAVITGLSFWGEIEQSWRYLFWCGALTAAIAILMRMKAREGEEYAAAHLPGVERPAPLWSVIREHRQALLAVVFAAGFAYTTYSLAFTLMNGYIPLVTSLSKTEVMAANTGLLVLDMALLPFFGYLAGKWGKVRVMGLAAAASVVSALPLFYLLQDARLGTVIAARLIIVTLGVAFSASYHAWCQERVPPLARYTILSLGYALGSQLIGAPSVTVSLWLFKKTGWFGAPALYIMATAAAAGYFVIRMSLQKSRFAQRTYPSKKFLSIF